MRELLFRGKLSGTLVDFHRAENGGSDWVVGWYCPFPFGSWPLTPAIVQAENAVKGSHVAWEIDPETLGQYTGLTDMHGEKIWEGDVVQFYGNGWDEEDGPGVIKWDNDSARIIIENNGLTVDFDNCSTGDVAVIGNIYDNPELLGE